MLFKKEARACFLNSTHCQPAESRSIPGINKQVSERIIYSKKLGEKTNHYHATTVVTKEGKKSKAFIHKEQLVAETLRTLCLIYFFLQNTHFQSFLHPLNQSRSKPPLRSASRSNTHYE